jgi:hypothetical protein
LLQHGVQQSEGAAMTDAHLPVTGGCLCGAVRYESRLAPTEGFYCHCRSCQRFAGGLFAAFVRLPRTSFAFTSGDPTFYRSSEVARRAFCSACGSPLIFIYDNADADFWVTVGSLDHPEDWPLIKGAGWGPTVHGTVDNKVPWQEIDDGLPQRTSDNALLRRQAEAALAQEHR